MRLYILFPLLLITSCSTTGHYEAKLHSWEGKDKESLIEAWGQPDAVESLHTGNKMLVYARLKRNPMNYQQAKQKHSTTDRAVYIRCATYFEVNPREEIVSTDFRGEECTSRN